MGWTYLPHQWSSIFFLVSRHAYIAEIGSSRPKSAQLVGKRTSGALNSHSSGFQKCCLVFGACESFLRSALTCAMFHKTGCSQDVVGAADSLGMPHRCNSTGRSKAMRDPESRGVRRQTSRLRCGWISANGRHANDCHTGICRYVSSLLPCS